MESIQLARRPTPTADDLLRTADVAVWIGRSSGWLDQGRMRGYGPPFVRIGRNVFYRRGDVQEWIENRTVGKGQIRRTK